MLTNNKLTISGNKISFNNSELLTTDAINNDSLINLTSTNSLPNALLSLTLDPNTGAIMFR